MKTNESYLQLIRELKQNIIHSRYEASRLANRELLKLYLSTGIKLSRKAASEKWGAKVIGQLALDLQNELTGLKGFSRRNLMNMKQFAEAYENTEFVQSATAQISSVSIVQSATAQLENDIELFYSISFTHHLILLNKCKNTEERLFYIRNTALQSWPVSILELKIAEKLYKHQGKLPNNFNSTVREDVKETALQLFQDEYLWDFMNLDGTEDERVIETEIVNNIRKFILGLGKGFAFMGNQYRLEVDGQEFFIDLLFYNRHLQCLVAFELKKGEFKPSYAGQLNFYLNVLDDKVKLPNESSSIGIILCKEKSNTIVEYAFRSLGTAMGAATFKTTRHIPDALRGVLPDERKLSELLNA
ncbi:YhcG family protein [Paradesertivirga mongoliensis]|uniref:YhcG family protein n=1 Tax=Paradesertivirga mongoliensis TaxID=2100740 RepID=A0ABW4ZQD1_9SPHI|nr:PDDEXK nuclease domain-containing protein [Pedobacter mongoliensis]